MFDRFRQSSKINPLKLSPAIAARGQSLVEVAIIAPLLVFMLIGVFEVGSALRGYLVLANANREITRFSVRPGYLDFSTVETTAESFQSVRERVDTSIGRQLVTNFDPAAGDTTMIISHVVVDTGLPCEDIYDNPAGCDCDAFTSTPGYSGTFTLDDLIIHPNIPGMDFHAQSFGPDTTVTGSRTSQIDYDELVYQELAPKNNKFNCELIKKGGVPTANNVIVTELFYDQPQLFGFPFVSNPYTDPLPLYSQVTMRLVGAARSNSSGIDLTANIDAIGPVCDAFPFVVHEDTIKFGTSDKIGTKVNIFDGPGGSDFGWLTWNPDHAVGSTSAPYLSDELSYAVSPLNDYTNARDTTDHTLSVGDYVTSMQGDKAAVEASDGLVSDLMKYSYFRIPVWDTFHPGTGAETDAYHIVGFAWVQIVSSTDINLPGKSVEAYYIGDATDSCRPVNI